MTAWFEEECVMRAVARISALVVAGLVIFAAHSDAQQVAKRTAKRAAKEATESAAKSAAEDAAKKAVKKAAAPDAIDLNAASPEQLAKLGLDEATVKAVVDARPFSGLDDPKLKAAIPAETLTKLEGKVTVKPAGPTTSDPAWVPAAQTPA